MTLPDRPENNGIYRRYHVTKCDPERDGPDDPNAVYFVLRLDSNCKDKDHLAACRIAARMYAHEMFASNPELAGDVANLVTVCESERNPK